MKNTQFLALAFLASALAAAPAMAQNTAHGPEDLVLTFQNPGGAVNPNTTGVAVLGDTGNGSFSSDPFSFRDAAPGSFTLLPINLNAALSNFGADWYDLTTLYLGAVDFRGNSDTSTALLPTGDPHRTLYMTKARAGVGTVGAANSSFAPIGVGNANAAINGITGVVNNAELTTAGSFPVVTFASLALSQVDDQNPFTVPGVQGPGYGVVGGGVQANFGDGSFGTFGAAGTIEMALDLYRVQFLNNVPGQYGFGAPTQTGEYLGTITIAQNGDVGFLKADAVPEPTSAALLALAAVGFAARRRRPVQTPA